ncbi:ABC transporter ATP-binding protein [Maridesulfovibrio sp.]|uniref:ABC transporter ATP-binding protein n=1 Tax=Maridesulfovibrio sp. TaxID=2795000 RepID=UPI002A1878C8|nr:ABC transporter ATP-binding protein [Maridesulfovibrio sp.]
MIGIRVSDMSKRYMTGDRSVQALDRVDFRIEPGSFVALIGYSGCGKTTLFRHISGLEKPDSGAVTFLNKSRQDSTDRPRLGMMFQEPRLLPWLTVQENLLLALRRTELENHKQAVRESLIQVGMQDFAQAYPEQLSGGMAQRAALARALCRKPELLLMDEPFGALDALTRLQLQMELARIWSENPMTVLCITHDIGEAVTLADLVLVMADGRIAADRAVTLPRPRRPGQPDFEIMKGEILDFILTNKKELTL